MNPRLSLQGRMSLDGWNGVGSGPDRGIDVHMDGVGRPSRGRHGRRSSIYQSQTTTLFNAFQESDGDPEMLPSTSHPHHQQQQQQQQQQQHRGRQSSTDLHRLKEEDELADGEEDGEEDANADRRALLRKGKPRQQHQSSRQQSRPMTTMGSRSRSPETGSSLTDVRITPR